MKIRRYFFFENLRIALAELWANKMRSLLTATGIVIGIIAVTLMSTLIAGVDGLFEKSMSFIGKDVVYIEKWPWVGGEEWWTIRNRPEIDLDLADEIAKRSDYALVVAKERGRGADLTYKEMKSEGIFVNGVTANYLEVSAVEVQFGRFFTDPEDRTYAQVILLGFEVAKSLFPNTDPLDKEVTMGGHRYRVIGILAQMGKFMGLQNMDTRVVIPLNTFEKNFQSRHGMIRITVKVPVDHINPAIEELRGVMRILRQQKPSEPDNFAVNQQQAFEEQYNMIKYAIGGTGLVITALSLLVGGIGIANIMFVSVKERTREIGVRKAMGAKKRHIKGQFLIEAVVITGVAGLVGLLVSISLSWAINKFVFPASMSFFVGFMAIALSVFVGMLAGWTPARQAANLDPIESLRYE
ncbi:MAG TPA: ABC transporter [Candidatus Marinimicrobia bacterium]|nr:MAG: ABC transporter [Candidatus Marinimicrobia bacterium CG_4_10_14_0_2_um_filter_48_9]PJA51605.1 MAG: ABC transporter [Candidatus Marinimicrobia bacterium CG_4_9_14_3_um_filter_48_9]HCW76869.1 ABC transporter [Candidatus Neomarinimicrobiota bacterium]